MECTKNTRRNPAVNLASGGAIHWRRGSAEKARVIQVIPAKNPIRKRKGKATQDRVAKELSEVPPDGLEPSTL
jgi:hypothetical protein